MSKQEHKFWNTQPVPQDEEQLSQIKIEDMGAIENTDISKVRKDPYNLPQNFEWVILDMNKEDDLEDLYNLLFKHYVEDSDNMFRFDYSKEFLKWALMVPNFDPEWFVGIRSTTGKKQLFGFISAIPCNISIYSNKIKSVEINFLCVHKKLRSKRMAPVLIKEITRRVNLKGVFQAVYTAGVEIPNPFSNMRYWHRLLSPLKLCQVGFTAYDKNKTTLNEFIEENGVDNKLNIDNISETKLEDIPVITNMLNKYLEKFNVHIIFDESEVRHLFVPIKDVVYSYVVKNSGGEITDFFSFYKIKSSVLNNPLHKEISVAYSLYNFSTQTDYKDLLNSSIILAKQNKFDAFNALDVLDNDVENILLPLKFKPGSGGLNYYMFNYKFPKQEPNKVGIVLL